MTQSNYLNNTIIQQWLVDNMDVEKISETLMNQGFSGDSIDEHIRAFTKAKIQQRQTKGILFMAVGAFIGFIGCVVAMINPNPTLYYISMYGLTSLAVVLAFVGFYYLFE